MPSGPQLTVHFGNADATAVDGPLLGIDFHATVNEPTIAALVVIAFVVMVMSMVIGAAFVFGQRRR
jgi:hypothetical protein